MVFGLMDGDLSMDTFVETLKYEYLQSVMCIKELLFSWFYLYGIFHTDHVTVEKHSYVK